VQQSLVSGIGPDAWRRTICAAPARDAFDGGDT